MFNNKPDGRYKQFNEYGKLKEEGAYIEGSKEGLTTAYYDTGKLEFEEMYIDNKVFWRKDYNKKGKLTKHNKY